MRAGVCACLHPLLVPLLLLVLNVALVRFELVARMGDTIVTLPDCTSQGCAWTAGGGCVLLRTGVRATHTHTYIDTLALVRHWRTAPAPSKYAEARPCLIVLRRLHARAARMSVKIAHVLDIVVQ